MHQFYEFARFCDHGIRSARAKIEIAQGILKGVVFFTIGLYLALTIAIKRFLLLS